MGHNHIAAGHEMPDYILTMPRLLTYPLWIGIGSVTLGGLFYFLFQAHPVVAFILLGVCILGGGAYVGIFTMVKRFTNLDRRLEARDRLLSQLSLRGDETILDVGCGNGILILGAAKGLTTGKGIGIDIWTESSGESRPEAFGKNAKLEGVEGRVCLKNEDVRQLPYDNEYFDIIMSGLTMHHISHGDDKNKAMGEMTRVLKKGGRLVIYDEPSNVNLSAKLMRKNGLEIEKKERDMVFAQKPQSAI